MPDDKPASLEDIDARLAAMRRRRAPPKQEARQGRLAGAEAGGRLVIDLVAGIAVGAGMGWGLDSLFSSKPLFLILFTLLGFAAGVRLMLHSAEDLRKRQEAARADPGNGDGGARPED